MMLRTLFHNFCTTLLLAFTASVAVAEEVIPLDEIEPGDKGVWKTVVSGTEIESFPLEVVGILESFVGPGVPIILCRATDTDNTATGPVSGMSGSPVYINGKLAGAYAYGFPWSKEKTLIGVTPIEWMDPLLSYPDTSYRNTQSTASLPNASSIPLGLYNPLESGMTSTAAAGAPQPLPIPLLAAGISPRTLSLIQPWLSEKGIHVTAGAGGSSSGTSGKPAQFEAGSPVAVILASGDLTLGGVGTITRREGDRILAFGHPMLGSGSVELPIGSAEIVDVVSSYQTSFKLSNIGEVAGTLWQDSTPGIQGELGRIPYMIPISINSNAGIQNPISGKIAEHRQLTPSMALVYAAQAILTSKEGPDGSTIQGSMKLSLEDHEAPLELKRSGVGFGGAIDILFSFAEVVDLVLNGSQEFPRIADIQFNFQTENREMSQILHSLRLSSARIQPGESVQLTITTRDRSGKAILHEVEVPLPPAPAGSSFTLFVADANALRSYDGIAKNDPSRPLDQLLTELRQLPDNSSIYIQLLRPVPGLRLDGRNLEELPPSVLRLYKSSLQEPGDLFLKESIVWQTAIPVPGVFSGSSRIQFNTEL